LLSIPHPQCFFSISEIKGWWFWRALKTTRGEERNSSGKT